jgi:toxin-antitoxin system PIN domain toxin
VILLDVNVLVYAFRPDAGDHERWRDWVQAATSSDAPFGVSPLALSGFVRVVTHPRVFARPDAVGDALDFTRALLARPTAVGVVAGPRHWAIFDRLCRAVDAKGNTVADAYHAALAIETGSEWITADRGFARFPGLRWRHPLAGAGG